MIELYIENQKIDLTDDIEINFTYETIDPDKLSSIKNSFSKTVNIPGTPNNNRIFGYIFRFDKYFNSLNTGKIGNDYDPHKKVNWFINKNGSLVNRGYCTLDNIKVKNDYEYTYQLTLYGGLGEFFYNLSYNEDGSPKTLVDLFWNWRPMNTIDDINLELNSTNNWNVHLWIRNNIWENNDNNSSFAYDVSNLKSIRINNMNSGSGGFYAFLKTIKNISAGSSVDLVDGGSIIEIIDIGEYIIDVPSDANYMWFGWKTGDTIYNTTINYITSPDKELTDVLYIANADNVARSYSLLDPFYNYEGITPICRDVTFVPCYTGLYEDFDSKTMLVATTLQNEEAIPGDQTISDNMRTMLSESFPDSISQDEKTYNTLNRNLEHIGNENYGLVKFSRDLDPFEAGEIRINEIPAAIRLSKLMAVISNPENNGGYTVEWDDVIKLSPYWIYSWIMLNKLTAEKEEVKAYSFEITDKDTSSIEFNDETYDAYTHQYFSKTLYDGPIEQGAYYAITNYDPSVSIRVPLNFNSKTNWNKYSSVALGRQWQGYTSIEEFLLNTFVILTTVNLNNTNSKTIADIILYTTEANEIRYDDPKYIGSLKPKLKGYLDNIEGLPHTIDEVKIYNLTTNDVSYEEGYGFANIVGKYNRQQFSHIVDITSYGDLKIKQYGVLCWNHRLFVRRSGEVQIDSYTAGIYGITTPSPRQFSNTHTFWSLPPEGPDPFITPQWEFTSNADPYVFEIDMDPNGKNGLYLKSSSGYAPIKIDKNILFANTQSPMKYLSSFCKLMNYKFICDDTKKTIYIKDLKNYYINNIYDLNDRIDFSRDINIKNITTKYKHLNVGLDTPLTYPVSLFNKSSKDKFNIERYYTNIEYPLPDSELLDDLIFQNTIDWQQSSIFYNIYPQCPKAFNTTTISWNLFNVDRETDDVKVQSQQFYTLGVPATGTSLLATNDWYPKNALFDNKNKAVDFESSLLFLNGFVKNYDYVKVPQSVSEEFINIIPFLVDVDKTISINGEIIQSNNQQISEYYFDSSKKYFITASFDNSTYEEDQTYVVNYYDVNNNWLGGEYTKAQVHQAGGFDKVEILNIPALTYTIYCVTENSQGAVVNRVENNNSDSTIITITTDLPVNWAGPGAVRSRTYGADKPMGSINTSQTASQYTDYVDITNYADKNAVLTYTNCTYNVSQSNIGFGLCFYDSDKVAISSEPIKGDAAAIGYETNTINVPTNAAYIRFTCLNQYINVFSASITYEGDPSYPLYTKQETYSYVISPRLLLSQDNFEQYYLNQERCYQYDFGYSIKNWYNWGFTPKTTGGSATSWVLPLFTKDLYNVYASGNTYEIEDTYRVLDNLYVTSTGTTESDNDFEVFQYNVDPSKQYKFSAKYSFDWSGIAIAYYDTNTQFISSEYVVTTPQAQFDEVVLTIPANATKMYVNVQKILSDSVVVKVLSDNIGWYPTSEKVASWNLTFQNGLDGLYSLINTNFVINPQFNYNMMAQSLNYINNNEYKIGYWPNDKMYGVNESRIFDTKWKNYLNDLYDRNTRDVVAYIDLSGFGNANNIMRNIYSWKSHLWIITKLENFKITETTHDKFTKVTMHKIKDISTWTN